MKTFDEYLAYQDAIANTVAILTDNVEPNVRCEWCGNLVPHNEMSEWMGEPMCCYCVDCEREEATAEQLRPSYEELFGELAG